MIKYLIVVEETPTGFSAYSPDLDGCVATGSSRADVEKNMREAIEFHLDGLRRDGYEVPKAHTYPAFFDLQS
jgi:predicted RNase H-like HicB family nuclease